MNNPPDFNGCYKTLRPLIDEVEQSRKHAIAEVLETRKRILVGGLVGAVLLGLVAGFNANGVVGLLFLVAVAGIVVTGISGQSKLDRYRRENLGKVAEALIKLRSAELAYQCNGMVDRSLFVASGLCRGHDIVSYSGNDRIAGTIGKTAIDCSEIDVTTSSHEGHDRPLFWGLFFTADFNKNFSGSTYVLSHEGFGGISQGMSISPTYSGQPVKLEDPEFERAFATHGTDQIEARYILTPALMRRIAEFSQQNEHPINLAFVDSRMFIAIGAARSGLTPTIGQTVDRLQLQRIWSRLDFLTGIVDELHLNERLWTKQ
jgi:Protein of unknown function (DUF3137)